jgi:hypothetical protein
MLLYTNTKGARMFNTNTPAKAKIIKNKKLGTVKVVVAFNVHLKENAKGELVYAFPSQQKCAYVSGDINPTEVLNTLTNASSVIRSSAIELVA